MSILAAECVILNTTWGVVDVPMFASSVAVIPNSWMDPSWDSNVQWIALFSGTSSENRVVNKFVVTFVIKT